MTKTIDALKDWLNERENVLGQINRQIKEYQKNIIDKDLQRLDVENDIESLKKAIEKLETEPIKITDIDKFLDNWGPAGEDNFYYVGAKDMLKDLIKRGFLEGPENDKDKN